MILAENRHLAVLEAYIDVVGIAPEIRFFGLERYYKVFCSAWNQFFELLELIILMILGENPWPFLVSERMRDGEEAWCSAFLLKIAISLSWRRT